jgi:uncharacterized phage protein gp47/JayE
MAAPTWEDLYNTAKAEAILRRPTLSVRPGDISDMFLAGGAAMGDRAIGFAAERFNALFLDGARGADLTKLAADRFGVEREAAQKAIGSVTFNRAIADATAQTFPIGTVVATERDARGVEVRYLTTSAVSWAASENGTKVATTEAETEGVAGNVAANAVTRIVSTPPAGGTYTISASAATAGGSPEETDPELRERCRGVASTRERGTLKALETGALQVPIVRRATAVEDLSGLTIVFVTDAAGGSTGDPVLVTPAVVDDGTMTKKVAVELMFWRAAGAVVTVTGGILQTVDITLQLTVKLGIDIGALIVKIQGALPIQIARLAIGQTLYRDYIQAAVRAVDPDNIVAVGVLAPVVDVAPTTSGHVIRAGVVGVA